MHVIFLWKKGLTSWSPKRYVPKLSERVFSAKHVNIHETKPGVQGCSVGDQMVYVVLVCFGDSSLLSMILHVVGWVFQPSIVHLVWWFGTWLWFFHREFHYPNWRTHIFQRGRSTTNQHRFFAPWMTTLRSQERRKGPCMIRAWRCRSLKGLVGWWF